MCEGPSKKKQKQSSDDVFKAVAEADNKFGLKSCSLSKNCKHKF